MPGHRITAHARRAANRPPEDGPVDPREHPEDMASNPEDSPDSGPRKRSYYLSEQGRNRLSNDGKQRWAALAAAEVRDAELSRREERLEAALQTPIDVHLREMLSREVSELPEVTTETILRVNGRDYCIHADGRLEHLYFPSGEKTELEDGEWFRFAGRPHCIRSRSLRAVSPTSILDRVLRRRD